MAEDGTSALSSVSHKTFAPPPTGLTSFATPPTESMSSTSVTAEIPAVGAGPSYGVLLPDGSIWYPGSQKRLAAPLLLRVFVWVLAFACLLVGAGVLVMHEHPTWANPFRRIESTRTTSSLATGGTTHHGTGGHSSTGSHGNTGGSTGQSTGPLVPQPAGLPANTVAYRVPSGTYTVTVTVAPGHDAWVAAYSMSFGQVGSIFQQKTLFTGQTFTVSTANEFQIEVAALGTTMQISQNAKVLATVTAPMHVPAYWRFLPASSG